MTKVLGVNIKVMKQIKRLLKEMKAEKSLINIFKEYEDRPQKELLPILEGYTIKTVCSITQFVSNFKEATGYKISANQVLNLLCDEKILITFGNRQTDNGHQMHPEANGYKKYFDFQTGNIRESINKNTQNKTYLAYLTPEGQEWLFDLLVQNYIKVKQEV